MPASPAKADDVTSVELGTLPMGEARTLRLTLPAAWARPDVALLEVETSCHCLQVLSFPTEASAGATITLRYLALREGPIAVEVQLTVADGTGAVAAAPLRWQVSGSVAAGDRSRALVLETIAPELFQHRDETIPDGLIVDGVEARRLVEQAGAMLIDARSPRARASAALPGSVALAPRELRSKGYLGSQPLIFVGEAALSSELLGELVGLRQAGFARLHFLEGGAASWLAAGASAPAVDAAQPVGVVLSASELHAAANRGRYLLVDASGEELSSYYLPEAVALPAPGNDPAMWDEGLRQLAAAHRDRRLVLVTPEAPTSAQQALAAAHGVWLLREGFRGYRDFLATQTQALLAQHDGRHRVQARQGGVTADFPRALLSSGCSSCPGSR